MYICTCKTRISDMHICIYIYMYMHMIEGGTTWGTSTAVPEADARYLSPGWFQPRARVLQQRLHVRFPMSNSPLSYVNFLR